MVHLFTLHLVNNFYICFSFFFFKFDVTNTQANIEYWPWTHCCKWSKQFLIVDVYVYIILYNIFYESVTRLIIFSCMDYFSKMSLTAINGKLWNKTYYNNHLPTLDIGLCSVFKFNLIFLVYIKNLKKKTLRLVYNSIHIFS